MNAGFSLRQAESKDAGAIRGLVLGARINPTGLDWRRFLVAEDGGGKVIGCGQVKPVPGGVRELASIVVKPRWRGKGVARALIERLMRESGPPLWLTCTSELVSLYRRFGFEESTEQETPRYFRRLQRLAKVFGLLIGPGRYLAVMRWTE
jgi:amino-acid N-acetyltransferase